MTEIREFMKTDLITVRPDTPAVDAIKLLIKHRISGLPVVNEQNDIVGILSEKDLLELFSQPTKDCAVKALMTPDPEAIEVEADLVEVFDCLMSSDFRRVLIHEKGKLVGLVSRADLMPAILDAMLDPAL